MAARAMTGAGRPPHRARGAPGSVLCVANFPSDTGYAWWLMEEFWIALAGLAEAAGGSALVAFPTLSSLSPRLSRALISAIELEVPTSLPVGLAGVRKLIRERGVRTIYLTDRHYWSPAYALFRSWGVESIILHDHVPGERQTPGVLRLAAKRARFLIRPARADLYIGVSRFVQRRFTAIAGVPVQLCSCVHNGVEPYRGIPRDIRAALELPADSRIVVSVGRAHPYKGVDFMIECAAALLRLDGMGDVHFVHIGDGPALPQYALRIQNPDVRGRFHLWGADAQVPSLLPGCDLAFHASRGEAFSLAILEFMAAGLPVVAPDHCGNGEAISAGRTGFLYQPGDRDAAVGALARLLGDADLRKGFGEGGRAVAGARFSLDRARARFLEVVTPSLRV